MSHALRALTRSSAVRLLATPRPAACSCRPALQQAPAAVFSPSLLSRSYASKKSKGGKKAAAAFEEDDDPAPAKGKGGKKGKGKSFAEEEVAAAGGDEVRFDLKAVEQAMDESVDKLRVGLKSVVGRVGRVSPDLLNGVKVEMEGQRRPLGEFATVSVKDGKDLLVTVYDEAYLKAVSQALYASSLNLAPQTTSATALRVPVPRADWDKRQQLVRQASELCESARVAVRSSRTKGQKDLKSDIDAKAFSKDEGRTETKRLDTSTKKRTDEVDAIFEQAKKVLMDE